VEKSDEKAVEHYKLAANKGNVNARYNLGNWSFIFPFEY
jgi:TPR repeat protein